MAVQPQLPRSPYAPLLASQRWFPADEALRAASDERLLPPLAARIRTEVEAWRASEPVISSGVTEQRPKRRAIQAQSAAIARAMASICNDERASFGVVSGHVGTNHRLSGYAGASATSRSLRHWWFGQDHVQQRADGSTELFRWYFAQGEAVETVIWGCQKFCV